MWNLLYSKESNKNKESKKNVTFNYSLSGTLFTGLGLLGFNKTVKQANFFEKMIAYLNDKVDHPPYKQYIEFNVSDNNEYIGTIYYDSKANTFSYKKLNFNNV